MVWAGLRHAIPSHLKTNSNPVLETSHSLKINNEVFDVLEKISKHYYTLLISTKAKFPNNAQVLKRDFNLNKEQLKKVFILPHTVKLYSKLYPVMFGLKSIKFEFVILVSVTPMILK